MKNLTCTHCGRKAPGGILSSMSWGPEGATVKSICPDCKQAKGGGTGARTQVA
jgi:hypothetical protein